MSILIIAIVISGGVALFITGTSLAVRSGRRKVAEQKKARDEVLTTLQTSSASLQAAEKLKKKITTYENKFSKIAALHSDSKDVPGYCTVDDEEWPCKTILLINPRTKPHTVESEEGAES